VRWLMQAARVWNGVVATPEGSLMQQVLQANLDLAADCEGVPAARLPWAAQLERSLRLVGVQFDPQQRQRLSVDGVQLAAMQRHLQRVAEAAAAVGASRLAHYFQRVRPECLSPDGYGRPAYLSRVRELRCRQGLTELRSGLHWGREEVDRRLGKLRPPPERRICQHCGNGVEHVEHILFDCPLYAVDRRRWPELFVERLPLHAFFAMHDQQLLARFAAACRHRAGKAKDLAPQPCTHVHGYLAPTAVAPPRC